jgi:hypothetical protein
MGDCKIKIRKKMFLFLVCIGLIIRFGGGEGENSILPHFHTIVTREIKEVIPFKKNKKREF